MSQKNLSYQSISRRQNNAILSPSMDTSTSTAMNDIPTARDLRSKVEINMIMHQLASVHFASRQFWFSTVPLAVLTMTCSILSFLSISKLFDETSGVPTELVTAVAIISALLVLLQTISGEADFAKRATMHEAATINLSNLRQQLEMCKGKIELKERQRQMIQRSRSSNSVVVASASYNGTNETITTEDYDDSGWDTFESVITMHQQYFQGCKSVLPPEISDAFLSLESQIRFFLCIHAQDFIDETRDPEIFEKKGYDMLSSEIVDHFWFPLYLPNSKKVTQRTMKQLHQDFSSYNPEADEYLESGGCCFGMCCKSKRSGNRLHAFLKSEHSRLIAQGGAGDTAIAD